MSTFDLPLPQIDEARLQALVTNAVLEGRRLEYKEELPGTGDGERREFLADASSFANAGGRDRFYGRSAIGRIPLDVWQIRDGFLRAATARERIQRFRAERVARIAADEMPAAVEGGPRLILHAVPLDSENASWSQFRALKDND